MGKMLEIQANIPRHVAIIMDGNGRWAKARNLDRTQGHYEGVKRVQEIVDVAQLLGVEVLTLFTFSTENWNRPKTEISVLMNLLAATLNFKIKRLEKNNIRFQTIGRREGLPQAVLDKIQETVARTKKNTGLTVNLAFNYGSRIEILDAIKKIALAVKSGQLNIEDICEETVTQALYTKGLPDPDLLIRTSGEKRISNFLLWQLSYSEFYFTEKYWPDFDESEFRKAILDYQGRDRRYGKLSSEVKR